MKIDEITLPTNISSDPTSTTTLPSTVTVASSEVPTVSSTQINSDIVVQETKQLLPAEITAKQEILSRIISEMYSTEETYKSELEKLQYFCNVKIQKISADRRLKINNTYGSYFGFGFLKKEVNTKSLLLAEIEYINQDKNFHLLINLETTLKILLASFKELNQMKERILKIKFNPNKNLLTFEEIRQFFNNMTAAFSKDGTINKALTAYVSMSNNYQTEFKKIPSLFFTDKEDPSVLENFGVAEGNWETFFNNRLIMPIQRIPRYKLLMEQFNKHAPNDFSLQEKEDLINKIDAMGKLITRFTPTLSTSVEEKELSFFERATSYYRSFTATGIEHTTADQAKKVKESKNGSPHNSRVEAKSNSKVSPVNSKADSIAEESDSSKSGSQVEISTPIIESDSNSSSLDDDGRRVSFIPFKDTETEQPKETTTEIPKSVSKIPPPRPPRKASIVPPPIRKELKEELQETRLRRATISQGNENKTSDTSSSTSGTDSAASTEVSRSSSTVAPAPIVRKPTGLTSRVALFEQKSDTTPVRRESISNKVPPLNKVSSISEMFKDKIITFKPLTGSGSIPTQSTKPASMNKGSH